jgi:hypothetical protein
MALDPTSLVDGDVIVPELFAPYYMNRSMEKSAVLRSGIANNDPLLASYASGKGQTYNLPHFNDLSGGDETMQEGVSLTVGNIDAAQQTSVVLNRAKAWGATYLARVTIGEDIMGTIGNEVGDYWARKHQSVLMSILNGMFKQAGAGTAGIIRATHLEDQGAAPTFEASYLIDAMGRLGDSSGQLTAIVMHSAIYHALQKNDLVEYLRDSEANIDIPIFLGKRVIVDDACVSETANIYRSYIFKSGAIGFGMGSIPPKEAVEQDRNSLASEDILITRQRFIMHPNGFAWGGPTSPTNADLADPNNWSKVFAEDKQIAVVALESKAVI